MEPGGIAYITVTDAAGRVLFRRPATANEVQDALRSADTADFEGEAAMDRIAQQRLHDELDNAGFERLVDLPSIEDFPPLQEL